MEEDKQGGSWVGKLLRNGWFQGASALGVVLGIVGFVIGLPPVAEMAFGKRVSLTLDVVSQIPVFAVRQPVPGLSVQLNSQDLTQTKRDLIAARLRLRNTGEVGINGRNTTSRDPLGFSVSGGDVVRLYELSATSEHLRKLAIPERRGNSFILPPGLIIDPNDFVQFDVLIVRPVGGSLSFRSMGKVEGLKQIAVGRADMAKPTPNVATVAWSGGLIAQLLRTVTYPFIAIALLAALIASGVAVSDLNAKRKRRRRELYLAKAARQWNQADAKMRKLVPALYAAAGLQGLNWLIDKNKQEERIKRQAAQVKRPANRSFNLTDFEAAEVIDNSLEDSEVSHFTIERLLARLKLRDRATGTVDDNLDLAIKEFIAALTQSVPEASLRRSDPSKDEFERSPFRSERVILNMALD